MAMHRRRFLQSAAALPLLLSGFNAPALGPLRPPPAVPVSWIARYLQVYGPVLQGPTTACHDCSATIAQQAVSLNVQNAPGPQLSWPYGYLANTGDTTFRAPYFGGALRTAALRMNGTCRDDLYSQQLVLANDHHGFPYTEPYLPSAAAHADAPNHRLLQWEQLAFGTPLGEPPNMAVVNQCLRAGYPVVVGFGSHAGCIMEVENKPDPDAWWYAGFDPLQGGDTYGMGVGVRPFTRGMLEDGGTNFIVYKEVSNLGASAPPSQQPLIDRIRADAASLTDPPTRAQRDALQADLNLLVVP